jgi:hypothetical protein
MATFSSSSPFVQSATSRYMMAIHSKGEVNQVFTMFFNTIAEVRKAVALNLSFMETNERNPALTRDPLNGFTVATLPAELVKARTQRYGCLTVAHRSDGSTKQWLDVISLR